VISAGSIVMQSSKPARHVAPMCRLIDLGGSLQKLGERTLKEFGPGQSRLTI
jgi:hypothetical protein